MTEPRNQAPDDDLAGHRALSAHFRAAATETSPPALDARILRAAHAAVRPRPRRWALPLAMAAAIVLCMSVLLNLPAGRTMPSIGTAASAPAEMKMASAPAAIDAVSAPAMRDRTAPSAPPRAAATVAAPAPATRERAPAQTDAPAAAPAASLAARMPRAAAEAPAEPGDARTSAAEFPAPALAAEPAPANKLVRQPPSSAGASAVDAAAAPDDPPASSGTLQSLPESPERWLLRIRRLRSSGDEAQAQRELRALRAHYPDYVLPPDLRGATP